MHLVAVLLFENSSKSIYIAVLCARGSLCCFGTCLSLFLPLALLPHEICVQRIAHQMPHETRTQSLWSSCSFVVRFFSILILSFERIVYAWITNCLLQLNGGTSFRKWDEKEKCVPKRNNFRIKVKQRACQRQLFILLVLFCRNFNFIEEEKRRKKIFVLFSSVIRSIV